MSYGHPCRKSGRHSQRRGDRCCKMSAAAVLRWQPSASRVRPPDAGSLLLNFFEEKGFGFITPYDGGDDCFAHVKDSPALENCQKGDSVSFDKVWDDRKSITGSEAEKTVGGFR